MPFTALIRDVPDFPRPGIVFKDIMPMLADGPAFAEAVAAMAAPWRQQPPQAVVGSKPAVSSSVRRSHANWA